MAWEQSANIRGPQGVKGDTGTQGIQGVKGDTGSKGDQGIQGIQGVQGERGLTGQDGKGIAIKGSVANYAALPTLANTPSLAAGDAYLLSDTGKLYIWSGTAFPANGAGTDFRGPQGVQGIQGTTGEQGIQGIQGPKGDTGTAGTAGTQGIQGVKGDTGNTGQTGVRGTKWYTGNGVPGTVAGSIIGDQYLDTATGNVYTLN